MRICFFTCPKPFVKEYRIIQINALKSWLCLNPPPNVIFLGKEPGSEKVVKKFKIKKKILNIKKNKYNTPIVNDIFKKVNQYYQFNQFDIGVYINSDILILNSFQDLIVSLFSKFKNFLIIGRRHELKIDYYISKKNIKQILSEINLGKIPLKGSSWIDYFIFTPNIFNAEEIPPFALGKTFWDKWLINYILKKNIPVIDATKAIKALHQTHKYINGFEKTWLSQEAYINLKLTKGLKNTSLINESSFFIGDKNKIIKNKIGLLTKCRKILYKIFDLLPVNIQFILIKIKRKSYKF